jgi:hypothetical protein
MRQVGEGGMVFNDISIPESGTSISEQKMHVSCFNLNRFHFFGREIRIGMVDTKKGDPGREPESPF